MNWHICHKKTTFLFVFLTYLPVFLLNIRLGELVGCRIWFQIQWVPTMHTFDRPHYPKNKKYLKKCDDDSVGTRWMRNQTPHPTSSPDRNLSKNTGRYVENTNQKVVFLWQICQFNHYGWLILLEFYWFLNSNSQELIVGEFS